MLPEYRRTLVEALPQAEVKVFAGLGHNPFWEKPREVADAINQFLAK
jgi:pimeloyl-ACP methyl ester carboxylesterase